MAKRRAGSQTGSLTPDQKKSRIDPIYLAADNVPHTVRKLSTRATTLLQTALRSEVCLQSYGAPKSKESQLAGFRTPTQESRESPGREKPFGCGPCGEVQGEPFAGREATALSFIREIKKVQGGEQVPRDGSLAFPKDVAMKPFSLKGLLNAILLILIPSLTRGPDGPPGGHADLGRSLPRLKENSLEGVLAVEVFATSLEPEVVEQKTPEDVEGLASLGEAARVVVVKVQGVVFFFEDDLPKEHEGPGDVEAVGHPPFVPNAEESVPRPLSRGAFPEAVLSGFHKSLITALAGGGDPHDLEPSVNRQPIVEDQPGERPYFAWAGVVPHSSNDLCDRRVAEIQVLDESDDVWGVLLPRIPVSPLSQVVEEGGVAHVARLLPVPVSGVPRKVGNEAELKNPVDWRSFSGGRDILGQSERCTVVLLCQYSDRLVPLKGDDDVMRAGGLDSAIARRSFKFLGTGCGVGCVGDLIDPLWWGGSVRFLFADPIPYHWFVTGGSRVPRNTINNEVPI